MSEFLKPQSPLQHKDGAYIYPLTTADQVILENGNRLNTALNNMSSKPKAGFIYPLAGSTIPEGFLLCDGAAYSRTEYKELFAAIGTVYGSGDGSTTFNVPNLQTRVPVGAGGEFSLGATGGETEHTLTVDEMPPHYHEIPWNLAGTDRRGTNNYTDSAGFNGNSEYYTDTRGGGAPHNNMQPYTVVNYIIATGKDTGVSVSDIIMGAQALPLEVQYGGTGATNVADVRKKFGIGVRNLLDNSNFANPLNRRGNTSYSGLYGSTIDRWLIYQISGQAEIHIEDGYIRLVPGRNLPSWTLKQEFPAGTFTASSYTLAYCDIDGNITIDNNPIYEDSNFFSGVAVQAISFSGTEETKLVWAALYEGEYTLENLPEYQPKSYAEEIVACNLGETGNVTGTELLWENASPNSNFASQTININLSGYDFLIIEFLTYVKSADYADYHRTVITRVGIKDNVSGFGETGSYFCFRGFTSNNSGITFETGHYADEYNDDDLGDSNNLYVPQKIYGIKGVSA